MSEKKVTTDQVEKALDALKNLGGAEQVEKGLKGSGPLVENSGEASGIGAPTQLHQGKGDSFSSVKSHAGTVTEDASFAGEYAPNGTDVNYGAVMKSILDLVAKGQLTPEAAAEIVKGMAPPFAAAGKKDDKKDDKKDKKDDKDEDDDDDGKGKPPPFAKKSLAEQAAEDLGQYVEVSEFLTGFVSTISKALESQEDRILKCVETMLESKLGSVSTKQETFNKSLAGAIHSLGEGLVATSARVEEVEKSPNGAPKSRVLSKSLGNDEYNLTRTEIATTLTDMVMTKGLTPHAVLKFESTGEISEDLMKSVVAHRAAK